MTLKRYRRGGWGQVIARSVNRALADLEGIASLPQVAGPTQMIAGVPVPASPPARERFLWLKVTGPVVPSAEPYYPDWVEQLDNGDGTFSDMPDGLVGGAQLLAYEVRDREAPVGAVGPAWVSGDDPQSVTFEYTPTPPSAVQYVTWTSNQIDFLPDPDAAYLLVDPVGTVALSSLGGGWEGRELRIVNRTGASLLTLISDDPLGTASMRMKLPGFANLPLRALEAVGLVYSAADSRWYALDDLADCPLLDSLHHTDTASASPVKGRLIAGEGASGAGTWATLDVGADGTQLTADSGAVIGASWQAPGLLSSSHGDTVPLAPVKGSLIVGNGTPKWQSLGVGVDGDVLTAHSASPQGVTWVTPSGGTVTSVSIATANGVSGSSSGGATPILTITLGAITPASVNGLTITTTVGGVLTVPNGVTLNAGPGGTLSATAFTAGGITVEL